MCEIILEQLTTNTTFCCTNIFIVMASMKTTTVKFEQVTFSHMLEKKFDIIGDEEFDNNLLLKHYTKANEINRIVVNDAILNTAAIEKNADDDAVACSAAEEFDEANFGDGPVMLLDAGDIVAKAEKWVRNMPRVQPFYAVKCNPNETVIKILAHALELIPSDVAARAHYTTVGFDCASKGEIAQVTGLGISQERIIFAHPCKMASHLTYARDHGVEMMTFDGLPELHKIKKLYPAAKLVLRLRVNDKGAQCPLGMKFGCERNQIAPLLATARQLGLDVIGISFHVGSGCRDATAFSDAIELARQAFNIGDTLGFNFTLLDIGGGFPGHKGAPIQFEPIAEVVNKALEQYFPLEKYSDVRVIAEPGRYFVASAFTLFVEIIAKKLAHENACEEIMYYVNDGVYGSFNCCMFDHATVEVTVPNSTSSANDLEGGKRSSIWGPTCDGLDKILDNITLPELEINDWLIFEDMGAYTIAAGSTFNGFPRPVLKPLCKRSVWQTIAPRLYNDEAASQVAADNGAEGVLVSFVCGGEGFEVGNEQHATDNSDDVGGVGGSGTAFGDDGGSVVSDISDFSSFGSMTDSAAAYAAGNAAMDADGLASSSASCAFASGTAAGVDNGFFDDSAYVYA